MKTSMNNPTSITALNSTFENRHTSYTYSTSSMPSSSPTPCTNSLLLTMTINYAILYLGQYYQLTFNLLNQSFNILSDIEINCQLPKQWAFSSNSSSPFPSCIPLLHPGQSLSFTVDLRLIDLPPASPSLIKSSASYHMNDSSHNYISNSNALTVYTSPLQAEMTITNRLHPNNLTFYEIIIKNRGSVPLYSPILYIFLDPCYQIVPDSLFINSLLLPDKDPSKGIHLTNIGADCFYIIHLTAKNLSTYIPPKYPDLQLTCGTHSFYSLS